MGKIVIKDLKFSSVYEATVKEVEEQAKAKAEKYEEGEISDSSSQKTSDVSDEAIDDSGICIQFLAMKLIFGCLGSPFEIQ